MVKWKVRAPMSFPPVYRRVITNALGGDTVVFDKFTTRQEANRRAESMRMFRAGLREYQMDSLHHVEMTMRIKTSVVREGELWIVTVKILPRKEVLDLVELVSNIH